MEALHLELKREKGTDKSTPGRLFANAHYFCYTLEDVVRGYGEKVDGKTAIPAGLYKVKLTHSTRFNRIMPMIYTEPNEYEVRKFGVSFKGVRFHGGNTSDNSEGCILVAHKRLNKDTIQITAESDLTALIEKHGGFATLFIS